MVASWITGGRRLTIQTPSGRVRSAPATQRLADLDIRTAPSGIAVNHHTAHNAGHRPNKKSQLILDNCAMPSQLDGRIGRHPF